MNWEHTSKPWAGASTQTSTQLLLPSIINPTMTGALTRFFPLLLLILLISEGLKLLLFTEPTSPFALSWLVLPSSAKLSFPGLRYSYSVICLFSSFFHKVDQSNDGGVSSWLFNRHHHIQEPAGIWQRTWIKSTAVLPDTKGLSVTSCNTL